ncbi:DUF2934 domain-containing protein [Candidatus Symbiobacter mobilis]|uniref:DUF2934 domain-containing protein n=1 Tax=Candidatus Symbiobacter mobilis CR TaxID=946483 RepID=U5NEB3_9BURK|nr:DUF2934 domain-containing protein [Candidatus Symbiobacter mobilis]AGX88568.1 hypothetical protein Cenrod_2514 [Candidatus Symbiobacter mobilis CR]
MATARKSSAASKKVADAAPVAAVPAEAAPAPETQAAPPASETVADAEACESKSCATRKGCGTRSRSKSANGLTPEQRLHYVEVAAFYIAERRGFAPGNPMEDWCAAEAEIDRLIATGHFSPK